MRKTSGPLVGLVGEPLERWRQGRLRAELDSRSSRSRARRGGPRGRGRGSTRRGGGSGRRRRAAAAGRRPAGRCDCRSPRRGRDRPTADRPRGSRSAVLRGPSGEGNHARGARARRRRRERARDRGGRSPPAASPRQPWLRTTRCRGGVERELDGPRHPGRHDLDAKAGTRPRRRSLAGDRPASASTPRRGRRRDRGGTSALTGCERPVLASARRAAGRFVAACGEPAARPIERHVSTREVYR